MQIWLRLAAAILLLISSVAMANDCAILATGSASDLAIDDPDRFEYLTRVCRGESRTRLPASAPSRPTSGTALQFKDRSVAKPAKPALPPGSRLVSDDKQRKQNEGCEFLFHSVPDSRHPVGTEACKDERNLVCKRVGASSFQWTEGGTACAINPDSLRVQELNLRNSKSALKGMKLFD